MADWKFKEQVHFLTQVYGGNVYDIAMISTAQADEDKDTIIEYLKAVQRYAENLITKTRNE